MPSLFASYLRVYEPLTAFDRDRQSLLAPVRPGGPGGRPGRRARSAADGGARGARRRLDPAARPARGGVRPGDRRHAAGLPVEPAGPGRRGGAERPGRGAVGARRRLRAAGAGRAGQGGRGRTGAAAPGCSSTACPGVHEQIATWGVPLRWFVLFDPAERELGHRAGPAGAALPHGDLQGPPPGPPGAVGAAQVGRRGTDHRGGRGERPLAGGVPPALGGGAGLRRPGRPAFRTRRSPRTTRPSWSPPASPRCRGARPTRRPRRTTSWWRGGVRCSSWSGATRANRPGALPR